MKLVRTILGLILAVMIAAALSAGCSGHEKKKKMGLEYYVPGKANGPKVHVDPDKPEKPPQDIPKDPDPITKVHPIFRGQIGVPISAQSIGAVDPDPTGYTVTGDYDGDAIPNDQEGVNNPYVADYPRIVTGITGSITMEIRVLESSLKENHTETVELTDENDTIKNSMEDWHYDQINKKTSAYISKESWENDESHKMMTSNSITIPPDTWSNNVNFVFGLGSWGGQNSSGGITLASSKEIADSMHKSSLSEKPVFPTVDYIDNLDRNGTYFTSDNIKNITQNYRNSDTIKSTSEYGPNAGVVIANLYIKNLSVNMPVHVSNIWCNLSFRTPAGEFIGVKNFRLRDIDTWEVYEQDIYGGESFGPFTVEITDINTANMKRALANGYVPQITILSCDMKPVLNSNYSPGVENFKIVEENAKGRTAEIKIIGKNMRESYRVCAFDVNNGVFTPGVSLKKALFNILNNRLKNEIWTTDENDTPMPLTITDDNLWWRRGEDENVWNQGNQNGNKWDNFETYVRNYGTIEPEVQPDGTVQLRNVTHRIESIKSIRGRVKYNPFDLSDNPDFDEQELLPQSKLNNMKYWVILHNGEKFNGDINDPIWVGDRYEIVFFEVEDFTKHFKNFNYSPLQSMATNYLATNWNRLSNEGEFARSINMGKLIKGDVVKLELDLDQYRTLFAPPSEGREFGGYAVNANIINAPLWNDFRYSFQGSEDLPEGQPQEFIHEAIGRVNQIALKITESKNARTYRISFWSSAESEASARSVSLTPAQLAENGGYIFINRKILGTDGQPLGPIAAGTYNVKVMAFGVQGNSEMPRASSSGVGGVSRVTVHAPAVGALPDRASYSLFGSLDQIQVAINEPDSGNQAEYYRIRVMGPESCGTSEFIDMAGQNDGAVKGITGHAGLNIISVKNAIHCGTGSAENDGITKQDVFKVEVYAINANNAETDGDPGNETPNPASAATIKDEVNKVLVTYDQYRSQKPEQCVPAKRNELFEPRDVDLEVNFNDGSGWFKLGLSSNDADLNDKTIKCNYTSNIDFVNKKVVIYFQPPAGSGTPQNSMYNVFRGGREEVDLYVRTVARPEYRDTLWLKPNESPSMDFSRNLRFFTVNATSNGLPTVNTLPGYDPLLYWMQNDFTDATYIEDYTVSGSRVTAHNGSIVNLGTSVPANDFRVVVPSPADMSADDNGKSNFFFAPAKFMIFAVKGSIVDQNIPAMLAERNHADKPLFRVIPGDKAIYVSGIDSQYGETFTVSWRKGAPSGTSENLSALPWQSATINAASGAVSQLITQAWDKNQVSGADEFADLKSNQIYTVCVTSANGIPSRSSRVYKQVTTIPQAVEYRLATPGFYENGFGMFGDPPVALLMNTGSELTEGVNFRYGYSLAAAPYGIYDTAAGTGAFSQNTFMRIFNNGSNVNALGMTPYAVNLGQVYSPPANQSFIDPLRGFFVLPRPSYWSRLETQGNIMDPEIVDERYGPESNVTGALTEDTVAVGKFSNCLYVRNQIGASGTKNGSRNIYPFGQTSLDYSRGTVSVWVNLKGSAATQYTQGYCSMVSSVVLVKFDNNAFSLAVDRKYTEVGSEGRIILNGAAFDSGAVTNGAWHHVYAVWDAAGGLANGARVRLWIDGVAVPEASSVTALPDLSSSIFSMAANPSVSAGGLGTKRAESIVQLDNLKLFRGSAIEDPSWEYNSGAGRERALHAIYGPYAGNPEYDYRPRITNESGGGVGFFCKPK